MKDTDSAFPLSDGVHAALGMTLRQYAAINLKVPRSGDADIDAMIRESRRAEFIGRILSGQVFKEICDEHRSYERIAEVVCYTADAMLNELEEKEKAK
jgi:hypothetical protein